MLTVALSWRKLLVASFAGALCGRSDHHFAELNRRIGVTKDE